MNTKKANDSKTSKNTTSDDEGKPVRARLRRLMSARSRTTTGDDAYDCDASFEAQGSCTSMNSFVATLDAVEQSLVATASDHAEGPLGTGSGFIGKWFYTGVGPVLGPKSKLNRQTNGPKLTGPKARSVLDRFLADLAWISDPKPVKNRYKTTCL